jgi:hypothetical protein
MINALKTKNALNKMKYEFDLLCDEFFKIPHIEIN